MKAVMIARITVESADEFYRRQQEYEAKRKEWYNLYASGARKRLVDKAAAELRRMEHPLFERCSLQFLRWERPPKSKRRCEELEAAIRGGMLPSGAVISVCGRPANPHRLTNGEEVKIVL